MAKSRDLAKSPLPTPPGPDAKPDEVRAYTAAVIAQARQGNEASVPVIRQWMADGGYVDRVGGDLAYQATASLARKMAGSDLVVREAVIQKAENLRNEICGPSSTPLERLLAERVVLCWTYLNYLELIYTQSTDNPTIPQALYRQKVLDRAHGRYLSAVKCLADVRRLALPALQVNIAKKQVNVAGSPG